MPSRRAPAPPRPRTGDRRGGAAKGLTYAASGVDIDAGDRAADLILARMRRTHGPRVIANDGGFAGLLRLDYNQRLFKRNYRDPVLVACTDGVGSKVLLAAKLGMHATIGQDCVAMSVNDLIVQGAEPLFFLDYIAVHQVVPSHVAAVVAGVADGCELAGCALLGGETAEMPDLYRAGEYDLVGFAVGVVELRRLIRPEMVRPGDIVLGLASSGVHSNGYSLVRRVVAHADLCLDQVYDALDARRTLGEVLLTPTRIYSKPIMAAMRAYRVKRVITGMAHMTGGGLAANLERALNPHVDAEIERGSWPVPPVFRFLRERGPIADAEMRRVFNMGIGYCVIVRPAFAGAVADRLRRAGETVHTIGRIVRGSGRVRES